MSNVVPFHIETDENFGGCPKCGKTSGFINDGPELWFTCDTHRTKWHVGSGAVRTCRACRAVDGRRRPKDAGQVIGGPL